LRTHRYQWAWSCIYPYGRNIWLEEHRSMSHNGDDDYNGRNDGDENDGTMRTGMMKRRKKRGKRKLYCLKFCFNQRKTYPKNVDLLPCLPAKTTYGHAQPHTRPENTACHAASLSNTNEAKHRAQCGKSCTRRADGCL
jgi:hypothetical protein